MGKKLSINIRTTWGDKHYVGLNGIEVFKSDGEPVNVVEVCSRYSFGHRYKSLCRRVYRESIKQEHRMSALLHSRGRTGSVSMFNMQ